MSVHVIDGNNWIRVKMATTFGSVIRDLYTETTASPHVKIWVFDGKGGNKRRRDIYPAYKMNRTPSGEDVQQNLSLMKAILTHTKAFTVQVDGYEGDDVIAAIVQHYQNIYPIKIFSTDRDLLQLTVHPNVSATSKLYDGVSAEEVRLFKTLTGDTSDKITGIPGLGPKTFQKINKPAIQAWLDSGERLTDASSFGLPPKMTQWLLAEQDEVRAMWTIIGFFPVPDIIKQFKAGVDNPVAANALMQEFFL